MNPLPEQVTGDGYNNLPTKVRIGCYDFVIEVSQSADSFAASEYGHTNFMSQKIRVAPGQTNQSLANTLFHECKHAVHWVYGLTDDSTEEEFTNLGANGLCAFFQDNPEFVAWFLKANAR